MLVSFRGRCLAIAWAIAICPSMLNAQPSQLEIVRIEEDWELHVTQPDSQIDAPQVTMTMAPFGDESDILFQLDLNHGSTPSFSTGGLQVRICDDSECLTSKRFLEDVKLDESSETLHWTHVIQKVTNGFFFGIKDGTSDSFGSFGGDASFIFISNADVGLGLNTLGFYTSQDSLSNSGVTYAGNRVNRLRLKKVRLFDAAGQVTEWTLNADVLE